MKRIVKLSILLCTSAAFTPLNPAATCSVPRVQTSAPVAVSRTAEPSQPDASVATSSLSADQLFEKARHANTQGAYLEVKQYLKEFMKVGSGDNLKKMSACNALAVIFSKQHMMEEARAYNQQAFEFYGFLSDEQKKEPKIQCQLGAIHLNKIFILHNEHRYDESLAIFKQEKVLIDWTLESFPGEAKAETCWFLGKLCLLDESLDCAFDYYNKAAQSYNRCAEDVKKKLISYYEAQRDERSPVSLINPFDGSYKMRIFFVLAQHCLQQGNAAQAVSHYTQALEYAKSVDAQTQTTEEYRTLMANIQSGARAARVKLFKNRACKVLAVLGVCAVATWLVSRLYKKHIVKH